MTNKTKLLAFATVLALGTSGTAIAEEKINADELQNKAETILKSEDGAEKVTVRVEIDPKTRPGSKTINFADFDLDGDGSLTRDEVGEKLFKTFDRDGNQVIDNIEMKKASVITLTPMKKKTIEIIDYNAPGKEQKTVVNEEEFLEKTQLSKFDEAGDGLSPLDFLGAPFIKVNVNPDGVIDLYEWKRAYAQSVKPKHEESFNYNG